MNRNLTKSLVRLALALTLTAVVFALPRDDVSAAEDVSPCIEICPLYAPNCDLTRCWCNDRYQWNVPGRHAGPGITTCTNCWDTGCTCFPVEW